MMLNLIVAIVLDQFGSVTTRDRMPITPVNIQRFNTVWGEVAREVYTPDVCKRAILHMHSESKIELDETKASDGRPKFNSSEKMKSEFIDRSEIVRNEHGIEESHSPNPELWNIDGTEVDYQGRYKVGSHCWYIQSRAKESGLIRGKPMNKAARKAGRIWDDGNGNTGGEDTSSIDVISDNFLCIRRVNRRLSDKHLVITTQMLNKTRKALMMYLPIEQLHNVLERVPPPLGMMTRSLNKRARDMRIARVITSLHTDMHATPVSKTSVEVSYIACWFLS